MKSKFRIEPCDCGIEDCMGKLLVSEDNALHGKVYVPDQIATAIADLMTAMVNINPNTVEGADFLEHIALAVWTATPESVRADKPPTTRLRSPMRCH